MKIPGGLLIILGGIALMTGNIVLANTAYIAAIALILLCSDKI